jgi:hypothetical protein
MGTLSPYDFETFYHGVCAELQTKERDPIPKEVVE